MHARVVTILSVQVQKDGQRQQGESVEDDSGSNISKESEVDLGTCAWELAVNRWGERVGEKYEP